MSLLHNRHTRTHTKWKRVSEWELEREWTQSGSSVCAMVCVCVWMHRSNVLHHQQYFTINGFWVGLSNCFLFVLLNSLYIFEMLMPVPVNMLWKVYKSIWDVLQCATENMFVQFWFFFASSSWLLFDLAGERMTEPVNTDQTEIENEWDWCVSAFGAMVCMCKFEYIKWTQANISRVRCVYLFLFLCCVVHTSRLTLRNWVLLGLLVFVVHRFLPPLLSRTMRWDWFDAVMLLAIIAEKYEQCFTSPNSICLNENLSTI